MSFNIPTVDGLPYRATRRWRRMYANAMVGLMLNHQLTPADRHAAACEQADYSWQQLYAQPQLPPVAQPVMIPGVVTGGAQLPGVTPQMLQGLAMLGQMMQLLQAAPVAATAPQLQITNSSEPAPETEPET